jgi:hypothetical protein
MVLQNGQLKPQLVQQGIRLFWFTPLQTYYVWMNMDDPVIGGYTREKSHCGVRLHSATMRTVISA